MKERCKDLVGKTVRVTREIPKRKGAPIPVGAILIIYSTWRGGFNADSGEKSTQRKHSIRGMWRKDFEVIGEKS